MPVLQALNIETDNTRRVSLKIRIVASLFLNLLLCNAALSQNPNEIFRYQADKIEVGLVYHYIKTNIDGTKPEHVSIRVVSKERIESFKFHPKESPAALVSADMDWNMFSARKLESWQLTDDGKKTLVATMDYKDEEKSVDVSLIPSGKPSEKTAIKRMPFHIYNFDFASLNFAFRHLIDPKKKFTIGITDPTFRQEGPIFEYRGEAEISYIGDERRNGIECRKYRIDGNGLSNRGGFIWASKEGGHFQDMEIDLPDNPAWKTFKFRLVGTEKMTVAEWEKFIKSQF